MKLTDHSIKLVYVDAGRNDRWNKQILGSVKKFVSLVKNDSFLVKDMKIFIEKE